MAYMYRIKLFILIVQQHQLWRQFVKTVMRFREEIMNTSKQKAFKDYLIREAQKEINSKHDIHLLSNIDQLIIYFTIHCRWTTASYSTLLLMSWYIHRVSDVLLTDIQLEWFFRTKSFKHHFIIILYAP